MSFELIIIIIHEYIQMLIDVNNAAWLLTKRPNANGK